MLLSSSSTSACMPSAIVAAFWPATPGADDDDLRRVHAGHAAHEDAAPALGAHERVGADLRGEPAGDLATSGASSGSERSGSSTVS